GEVHGDRRRAPARRHRRRRRQAAPGGGRPALTGGQRRQPSTSTAASSASLTSRPSRPSPRGRGSVRKLRARPTGRPLRPQATTPPSPGGATPAPLLSVTGLAKHFGDHPVLSGVDLEVSAGQVVALAGENGAGK